MFIFLRAKLTLYKRRGLIANRGVKTNLYSIQRDLSMYVLCLKEGVDFVLNFCSFLNVFIACMCKMCTQFETIKTMFLLPFCILYVNIFSFKCR